MVNDDVAKRRAYRRKKARRKHLKVLFLIILIISIIVGIVLSLTILFPIKKVFISGTSNYEHVQIKKALKLEGKNIFTVSETDLADSARRELPYLDSIEIHRKLPDTVTVKVTDAKEYLSYKIGKRYYTVSKKENVLNKYNEPVEKTVEVITDNVKCRVGHKIQYTDDRLSKAVGDILKQFDEKNIPLRYIDITQYSNIKLGLDERFTVLLGSTAYIENKCAHLKGMIDSIDKNESGTINLTMWTPKNSEGTFIKTAK